MTELNLSVLVDSQVYVKHWFETRKKTARESLSNSFMFGEVFLAYERDFNQNRALMRSRVKPLQKVSLEFAFQIYVAEKLKEELKNALNDFRCGGEDLLPMQQWVEAVTGQADAEDVAVMAHWIWMIKRKAYGLDVKYHIMPVVYGQQGGGKSRAIQCLIEPLRQYVLSISMDMLHDSRNYEGMANNYVVFFDELQGAQRTDLNALKKQISSDHNTFRRLYTTSTVTAPQLCSFIGATNKPVAENFSDNTGMRRFWELVALPRLDWKAINAIDYTELWAGVDESREEGYMSEATRTKIADKQGEMVVADDMDSFISELRLKSAGDLLPVHSQKLFDSYIVWASNQNIKHTISSISFGMRMKRRLPFVFKYEDGVKQKYYSISAKSPVHTYTDLKAIQGGKK